MSLEIPTIAVSTRPGLSENRDESISELASQVAQFCQAPFEGMERRSHSRLPYPKMIPFTPLCDDMVTVAGDPIHVVGKNLALLGLDFFHQEPITQRYGIVSLECSPERWTHFVIKLTWCRFLRTGWYDSGGRFVNVVDGGAVEDLIKKSGPEKM